MRSAVALLFLGLVYGSGVVAQQSSSEQRKSRTEEFLVTRGVPVNPGLPRIEGENEVQLRDARDVASRAVILCWLVASGHGADQDEIRESFKRSGLWELVSPNEREIFEAEIFSEQMRIDATWRVEALWTLLWTIQLVDELPYPTELCDVPALQRVMVDSQDLESFLSSASLRSSSKILDQLDLTYRLHWAVVEARLNEDGTPDGLDPGVIRERHYALNWMTWYADAWDDITTDT